MQPMSCGSCGCIYLLNNSVLWNDSFKSHEVFKAGCVTHLVNSSVLKYRAGAEDWLRYRWKLHWLWGCMYVVPSLLPFPTFLSINDTIPRIGNRSSAVRVRKKPYQDCCRPPVSFRICDQLKWLNSVQEKVSYSSHPAQHQYHYMLELAPHSFSGFLWLFHQNMPKSTWYCNKKN